MLDFPARIDDGDEGFESDDWQHTTRRSGHAVTYPLRADRWWINPGALDQQGDDAERCLGIRCNIWARSKHRSEITLALQGGGAPMSGELRWQDLAGAEETCFGKSRVLAYPLKKIELFLKEF